MGPRLSWVGSRAWEGAPHLGVLTLQWWGCHLAPQIPRLCPNPEGAKPLRHQLVPPMVTGGLYHLLQGKLVTHDFQAEP